MARVLGGGWHLHRVNGGVLLGCSCALYEVSDIGHYRRHYRLVHLLED